MRRRTFAFCFALLSLALATTNSSSQTVVRRPIVASAPPDFVTDNFTGSDATALTSHSPDVGGAWAKAANYTSNTAPVIDDSNRLRAQDNGTCLLYNATNPPSADYYVQADFSVVTNIGSGLWVIAGRYDQAADTGYYIYWYQDGGVIVLAKGNFNSGTTQLGSTFSASVSDGASHTVKLSMVGTTIKMFVDGVERTSVTDSDYTSAGKVALSLRGTSSNADGFRIDNFSAR